MKANLLFRLSVLAICVGCDPDEIEDDVWTVENREQLLVMEHGEDAETGEFAAWDIWGLPIRDGERTTYLLWENSPSNPFDLKPGDRFRFAESFEEDSFSDHYDGYYADPQDLIPVSE